ncbi:hypothetical protein [Plantactinospora sp. B5E13]|uniref:hypothetical protein n=1 Tax=Plantactinospora sp. B5E13 TaxID=3153758 RepID=UPI00325DDD5F
MPPADLPQDSPSPASPGRRSRVSGRYAAGQLLAAIVVLVVALPLLPLILLIVAWIRLRDRAAARATRRDSEAASIRSGVPAPVAP